MKKLVLLNLLFLIQALCKGDANETIPVLLRLNVDEQSQHHGYNYVDQFSHLMYAQLMAGKLKVWDSKDKNNRLTLDSIVAIQDASETFFSDVAYLDVYEKWTKTKSEITSTTVGFSLIAKGKIGENVTYGYFDYADVSAILAKSILTVNANGNYNQNFNHALMINAFDFAIIQFGVEVNENSDASEKIKKEYIATLPFNLKQFHVAPQRKIIHYTIEQQTKGNSKTIIFTNAFLVAFQNYLVTHPNFCKQMGLMNTDTINSKNQINLSNIEATEVWELKEGIVTQLQQLIITNNKQPLRPLSAGELMDIDFLFDNLDLLKLLHQKKYEYTITKINSQKIDIALSYSYKKKLLGLHWNDLNQKVKQP